MVTATKTGTRDTTYDLISVVYHQLQGAETYQTYMEDADRAGDQEVSQFFREAGQQSQQLADRAKMLLGHRLSESRTRA